MDREIRAITDRNFELCLLGERQAVISLEPNDRSNQMSEESIPAFPRTAGPVFSGVTAHSEQSGMTLRDYFAGQALVGLLANSAGQAIDDDNAAKILAIESYHLADAMMDARKV